MREWLVDLVGEGMAPAATLVLSAAIVLLLVFSVIWVAKRALGGQFGQRAKGRGPRLAVMDITAIDPKRKLVLVRRDEVEHLILIGGQNDIVIEANILRVASGARPARTEPSFRPDDAAPVDRRPAVAAAPSQQRPAPTPPAAQGPRPAANGAPRAKDVVQTSPLARPLPRAPSTPEISAPAPVVVDPDSRVEPVAATLPPQPAPEAPTAPPQRREPAFSDSPSSRQKAEPASPVKDEEPQQGADRATVADRAPDTAAPFPVVTEAPAGGPSSPVPDRKPAAEAPRSPADIVKNTAEAPAVVTTGRIVTAETPRPAPPRYVPVDRTGPPSQQIVTRTPVTTASGLVGNGEPPVQRVSVTGRDPSGGGMTGGSVNTPVAEPVAPAVQSMAAPADSGAFAAPPSPTRQDVPASRPVTAPRPAASTSAPDPSGERDRPQPAASAETQPENPRSNPPKMREMAPRTGEPASGLIGAAERQRELIRARPTPTMRPPAETTPAGPDLTRTAGVQVPLPPGSVPDTASGARAAPEVAPPEKKPLEVRSFAASIQAGGRVTQGAPTPVDRTPSSVQPPDRSPADEPTPAAAPRRPLVEPAAPVASSPVAPVASAPAARVAAEPAKGNDGADDDFAGLEDFLSAELDFGLDDVHWNDEPEGAAPEVRVDEPKSTTDSKPADSKPADSKSADSEAESEAKKPRALTLEEEMERLLGDFNFETSDRGRR
ncbi:hypothetical protein Sa4125_26280 [Aureimonas sp. SA4125]|uniref:flagellar biosynthetic protein FliO n=1 Tax=Aureimonas sp. SA4125 TaxID=2826993 RepID=UPI001CC45F43|nr:flagellar biosynthetic protein FliO [Aureimonas sp. SA4125]BDA85086.1 hypothetical protein Sa4125_26280 [Aureimonas sp. SA4125]